LPKAMSIASGVGIKKLWTSSKLSEYQIMGKCKKPV